MDGIDEVQTYLIDRLYLLAIGIGRTRNRLLLFMENLGLMCSGIPLFSHGSNGAWRICKLLLFGCQVLLDLTKFFYQFNTTLL
jgi:hypothetical protein